MVVAPVEADQVDSVARPRRHDRRLFRFTMGIAIVTALLTVGTPLLGLRSLHSADLMARLYPWRTTATDLRPQNGILTDSVDAGTPMHHAARERILHGDFPLATEYPSGGVSLGTTPNWTVLGPLDLPNMLLPSWYAPGFVKLLELLVALAFTFLFLRLLGLGRAAAAFGGMVFMNSGYLLVFTNWPQDGVATLIPAVFWAVERALQRRTMRSALPLAGMTAAALLQGFPAITGYTLVAAGIYATVRVLAERRAARDWVAEAWARVRRLLLLAGGVVLGFGLAALQLVPFAKELGNSYLEYRNQNPHSILPPYTLVTAAMPNALGLPRAGVQYGARNYAEVQMFVGAATLALIVVGLVRVRRAMMPRGVVTYLLGTSAVCVVLIVVGGLPLEIAQKTMPPLFGINFVGRLRSVLGFLVACVAALCFHALVVDDGARDNRRRIRAVVVYAAAAWFAMQGYLAARRVANAAGHGDFFRHQAPRPILTAIVALAALALATRSRGARRVTALCVVPLLLAVESVTYAHAYLPRIPVSEFYPVTDTHRYVLDHIGHERMAAADAVMNPGATTYYGIRSVTSHAFHAKEWQDVLLAAGARAMPTLPLLHPDEAVGQSPLLDRLGAKYWVTAPTATLGTAIPMEPAQGVVMIPPGQPADVPAGRAHVRGVGVVIGRSTIKRDEVVMLAAQALDASGHVVGEGYRRVTPESHGPFLVPMSESDAVVATIRLSTRGARTPLPVAADTSGRRPAVSFTVAAGDGFRLVQAGGAIVYERLHALPRIRWASRSVVERDGAAQLTTLRNGLPADTVLLGADAPAASGAPGTVTIREDGGDEVRVTVDAKGDGYLVVADAKQKGWRARVDGKAARILPADHAVVAVRVPAGTHDVTFDFHPAGWSTGLAISALSVLVVAGVALTSGRWSAWGALAGRSPRTAGPARDPAATPRPAPGSTASPPTP